MEYYHDLVTQKSWIELQNLKQMFNFVLIGGWAVYLYTKTLKSKDIDIIIDFDKLSILEKHYSLFKNDRLKKYEAVLDEVQIDIYLPHYSQIGIPAEVLIKQVYETEGFTVLDINYLVSLKIYTLSKRGRTPKGRKDFIDLISLINTNLVDLTKVVEIIKKYNFQTSLNKFIEFLNENLELPELEINKHKFSKIKKDIYLRSNLRGLI